MRTVSPSQSAPSDGDARARRLVGRRRGGALLTGLHTDLCTGARAKKIPKMALRARRAENKKAHTGVAVWAFTLSRYRAGGLLCTPLDKTFRCQSEPSSRPTAHVDTLAFRMSALGLLVVRLWADTYSSTHTCPLVHPSLRPGLLA